MMMKRERMKRNQLKHDQMKHGQLKHEQMHHGQLKHEQMHHGQLKCSLRKFVSAAVLCILLLCSLTACVNQYPEETQGDAQNLDAALSEDSTFLEIDDPVEKAAVEAARKKVLAKTNDGQEVRIIATSPAVAAICDKLELSLVGVCSSSTSTIPDRYKDLTTVGTAMSPDMEIVSSLNPDWILSPSSLQSDLEAKYEELDTEWAFLNLKSVQGMYRSIAELGMIFDREAQAQTLIEEFTSFYREYQENNEGKEAPKVLILMGLPGSYVIATENSYVGSLVAMAGGENVYAGSEEEFLSVNTEDMKTKEPDLILRAAHALPDQVQEMFAEEFSTNDIWKHFDAVENGRVYDLDYSLFGMSANFEYQDALEELQKMLYPETEADSGTKAETEAGSGTKAETEAGSGTKAETEAGSGTKAKTEAGSGTKAETEAGSGTKTKTGAALSTKSEKKQTESKSGEGN